MANVTRSEKLDLRLTPAAKRLLHAAAAAAAERRSVSEFVLDSALSRAEEMSALADTRRSLVRPCGSGNPTPPRQRR